MKKQTQPEIQLPVFADEYPDAFTVLEAMVSKTGNQEINGPLKGVSLRLPMYDYCTVMAMSQYSGQSLNKIIGQMIALAIERLNAELGAEDLNGIQTLRSALIEQEFKLPSKFKKGGK